MIFTKRGHSMLHMIRSRYINTFILVTSLTCFTLATLSPNYLYCDIFHEAIFYNDLAKAVKKLTKTNDPNKSISALFHLKKLIENAYGMKINMEGCLSDAQKQAMSSGFELSKEEMHVLSKLLKIKKLKLLYKSEFMNGTMSSDECDFFLYDLAEKAKDTCQNMSGNIVVGISCLLGAFFLRYVPLPDAKVLSDGLMITGLTYLGNEMVDRHNKEYEEHKEKEQHQKNNDNKKFYPSDNDDIIFAKISE